MKNQQSYTLKNLIQFSLNSISKMSIPERRMQIHNYVLTVNTSIHKPGIDAKYGYALRSLALQIKTTFKDSHISNTQEDAMHKL